ncbi:nitroreductase/quinone reductase family protein [Actinoplanes sp. NPDC000266]
MPPPRWFVRGAWVAHKALLRVTADRVGMSTPAPGGKFGILRLHTVGRRSGRPRAVLLGYIEDGDRLVTLAMNGWDAADPAWWHNLRARPGATVDLVGGSREVTAHEATGAERERLWKALHDYSGYGDLDAYAARRGRETAVVVLSTASSQP